MKTWLVLAIAITACTSTPASIDAGTDANPPIDAADVAPSDAGDVASTPDAPGLWPNGGELSVTVANFGAGTSVSAAAAFWNGTSSGTGVVCGERSDGACTVRTCAPMGNSMAPSAGAIAMSVDGVMRLTLTPGANGAYPTAGRSVPPWSAGAMIRFDATGADVPAFSATLVAPPALTVTVPDPTASSVDVPRASGFVAQWTPGVGTVRVSIRQQRAIGASALQGGVTVECFFDRMLGTGTVPPTALSDFVAATGTMPNAEVLVFGVDAQNVVARGASVLVMTNAGGVYAQGVVR